MRAIFLERARRVLRAVAKNIRAARRVAELAAARSIIRDLDAQLSK